jgi:hypothetical protein
MGAHIAPHCHSWRINAGRHIGRADTSGGPTHRAGRHIGRADTSGGSYRVVIVGIRAGTSGGSYIVLIVVSKAFGDIPPSGHNSVCAHAAFAPTDYGPTDAPLFVYLSPHS